MRSLRTIRHIISMHPQLANEVLENLDVRYPTSFSSREIYMTVNEGKIYFSNTTYGLTSPFGDYTPILIFDVYYNNGDSPAVKLRSLQDKKFLETLKDAVPNAHTDVPFLDTLALLTPFTVDKKQLRSVEHHLLGYSAERLEATKDIINYTYESMYGTAHRLVTSRLRTEIMILANRSNPKFMLTNVPVGIQTKFAKVIKFEIDNPDTIPCRSLEECFYKTLKDDAEVVVVPYKEYADAKEHIVKWLTAVKLNSNTL